MPLTGKDMLKLAKKNGWIEVRQKGSHHILQKDGFPVVVIPIHGNEDLKKGLVQSLFTDLGIKRP
ncbi:type II toxin-antitoxin system HicA family toxin [uncultured Enterococcus sp.]|uniref:type II toxin-antitoxin system HicA family toxin n=1 Tax=uncultured Enterococcus sp. TaxID=167972 RepID=UPI00262EEC93|nr:type II toxin-antitoxin system HicA family toxin [uncultured Enterococcus sp.]